MSKKRKVVYWGPKNCEHLTHDNIEDAVEEMLEEFAGPEKFPEKIQVYGYARKKIVMPDVVGWLLEALDEEYSDPDGDEISKPTPKMKLAENVFYGVVRSEYYTFTCEIIETVEIYVSDWVELYRPDWRMSFSDESLHQEENEIMLRKCMICGKLYDRDAMFKKRSSRTTMHRLPRMVCSPKCALKKLETSSSRVVLPEAYRKNKHGESPEKLAIKYGVKPDAVIARISSYVQTLYVVRYWRWRK